MEAAKMESKWVTQHYGGEHMEKENKKKNISRERSAAGQLA